MKYEFRNDFKNDRNKIWIQTIKKTAIKQIAAFFNYIAQCLEHIFWFGTFFIKPMQLSKNIESQ